jgi:hypothetical protein
MSLSPDDLLANTYCVHEVSKDLDGQTVVLHADHRVCSSPSCEPLVLLQFLRLDATFNKPCDSQHGMALDGLIQVRDLTTVFTGPKEDLRGVHAGRFNWTPTAGGRITGTLEGISNAGVLRPQPFRDGCERCDEAGIVSGHLSGTGNGVPGVPVPDFQVEANYRLAWDPTAKILSTAPVRGTLEGVLILPCQ